MTTIDYYFFAPSPFTYLGHDFIRKVARKHGASIAYKPVNLMGVWAESGAEPPAKRPPIRQAYRLIELQRLSDYRGIPLKSKPKHFPVDGTLADSAAIAIVERGGDPHDYILANCRSVWVEDADIADEAVVRANLMAAGHDADAIVGEAASQKVADIRERNTQEAIKANAPGVPAYVVNGEVFWGQDRVEHLDHMLASGRDAIVMAN